ncbi:MAG: T9SS type A sorting domain-containing protein [bacterium]|nr:T9SS type A sorting domain-containing protein [bacterium]
MYDSNGVYIEDFIPNGSGGLMTPNAVVIRELNPSSVSGDENSSNLNNFLLEQNYPNPFNPITVIRYQLPVTGKVSLKVYNVLGNEVATLVNSELSAGEYELEFNASHLSSGVYYYVLSSGNFSSAKKMMLVK